VKVAVVAPVWFSAPPATHGGIETIVSMLAAELVRLGHEVLLYSVGTSTSPARVRWLFEQPQERHLWTASHADIECAHALFAYRDAAEEKVDLVHDSSGRVGPALGGMLAGPPVLHTIHVAVNEAKQSVYRQLAQLPRVFLSTVSHDQTRSLVDVPVLRVIHHGIDPDRYRFVADKDGYLAFLGRVSADKGCHLAIDVARRAGLPLRIAGPQDYTPQGRRYFADEIQPRLGKDIEYVGELGFDRKVDLLAGALALLAPVTWREPFALVPIEALACGTPVVATPRGGYPELVREGVDGFLAEDVDDLAAAVTRVGELDPATCRRRVEDSFSVRVMAQHYLDAYAEVTGLR